MNCTTSTSAHDPRGSLPSSATLAHAVAVAEVVLVFAVSGSWDDHCHRTYTRLGWFPSGGQAMERIRPGVRTPMIVVFLFGLPLVKAHSPERFERTD